jgi:sugar lactone lactonase YvrE
MIRVFAITISAIVAVCMFLPTETRAHPAWGIVVDRQGQVYFSDLETIWKIDAQGRLSVFRAGVSGRHIHDLTMDVDGTLYGAEYTYESQTERYIEAIWNATPNGSVTYTLAPTDSPPRGVSIWRDRDGNTYAVEQNNHLKRETLLLKRTPNGNVAVLAGGSYGHADGRGSQAKFSSINKIAFGSDGALYLTDGSTVRKVATDGTVSTLARNLVVENPADSQRGGAGSHLFGLTVDAQGNVFVADHGNRRVLKIAPDGRVATLLSAEQPWSPTGVALKDGNLYILEFGFTLPRTSHGSRVRKLSPDGKVSVLASVGENSTATTLEDSNGDDSERTAESKRHTSYALIGASMGILVLTLFIWRVRRRTPDHQH